MLWDTKDADPTLGSCRGDVLSLGTTIRYRTVPEFSKRSLVGPSCMIGKGGWLVSRDTMEIGVMNPDRPSTSLPPVLL